jgi:hypothetical protein
MYAQCIFCTHATASLPFDPVAWPSTNACGHYKHATHGIDEHVADGPLCVIRSLSIARERACGPFEDGFGLGCSLA